MARLRDRPELAARDYLAERVQPSIRKGFEAAVRKMRRAATVRNVNSGAIEEIVDESMRAFEEALREAVLAGGSLVDEEVNEVSRDRV